jgi:hypothetical protein
VEVSLERRRDFGMSFVLNGGIATTFCSICDVELGGRFLVNFVSTL